MKVIKSFVERTKEDVIITVEHRGKIFDVGLEAVDGKFGDYNSLYTSNGAYFSLTNRTRRKHYLTILLGAIDALTSEKQLEKSASAKNGKSKTYPVYSMVSELPSFSWNDSLVILVRKIEHELIELCKLDIHGKPNLKKDGSFDVYVTGQRNRGLKKTNLTYKHEA